MKKVAIYARVSTDKQELENQLIQLRSYAEKSGWEIYKEYADVISGKHTSRPAFDRLFKDARQKLFDIVLFWDLSRFSRAGTLDTLQRLKELTSNNIEWHSYSEQYISTAGDFKDVVISIMATLAKVERKKISRRTKAGLERARKEGKKLGRPKLSRYHINKVKQLYSDGLSMNKIAKQLNISYGSVWNIIKKRE